METALSVVVGWGDERDALRLGALLAKGVEKLPASLTICLRGGLGSGKTTLVRGLCAALPGGDEAEVSSPSFTIVNIYPTRPEVMHMDLYRLEGLVTDDLFEECAPPPAPGAVRLTVIEWAEYLPQRMTPNDRLTLTWLACETGRKARFEARGPVAEGLLQEMTPGLADFAVHDLDGDERTDAGRGVRP